MTAEPHVSCLPPPEVEFDPRTLAFYRRTLEVLSGSAIPFLVGGAYAFERYTGIERHTKDLDLFVARADCDRLLARMANHGYGVELTFPHWLAKAFEGDQFIDVIFSSGNGVAQVDAEWFENACEANVFGYWTRLCAPEEMIWSKAFIMERERFDGADVAHLIRAQADRIDWQRLLRRFGPHWRVLLAHLALYGFIYPGERTRVPREIVDELMARWHREPHDSTADPNVCQGTLLSRQQYLPDVSVWGYQDARLIPRGTMTPAELKHWTDAIGKK